MLKKVKGIAHDLVHHLDYLLWFDYLRDFFNGDLSTNILENKNSFDKMCVDFFKERLPESFDFNRFSYIILEIHRARATLNIKIKIKVDGEEFMYKNKSKMLRGN